MLQPEQHLIDHIASSISDTLGAVGDAELNSRCREAVPSLGARRHEHVRPAAPSTDRPSRNDHRTHAPPRHSTDYSPRYCSSPTVSPGCPPTRRTPSKTPGMKLTRSKLSCRIVSASPTAPKVTSWCAT